MPTPARPAGGGGRSSLKTLQTLLRLCRAMYDIVDMVGDQYIVKTDKGLKRVKIKASDNKRIGDQIY